MHLTSLFFWSLFQWKIPIRFPVGLSFRAAPLSPTGEYLFKKPSRPGSPSRYLEENTYNSRINYAVESEERAAESARQSKRKKFYMHHEEENVKSRRSRSQGGLGIDLSDHLTRGTPESMFLTSLKYHVQPSPDMGMTRKRFTRGQHYM